MKFKKIDLIVLVGAVIILGPPYFNYWPGNWWYGVMLITSVLMMIVGKGALMDQLGQGDTGEDLLREIWSAIKKTCRKVRDVFRSSSKM